MAGEPIAQVWSWEMTETGIQFVDPQSATIVGKWEHLRDMADMSVMFARLDDCMLIDGMEKVVGR